jgi:hypothetical protein
MPRQQPPSGYYTPTQTKEILNISAAMISNYVEKGRIKHFVPLGRKHGFYLKKDVDKLAKELKFPELENEIDQTTIEPATAQDIPGCILLNKELFPDIQDYDNEALAKKWEGWINKNPEIVYILKREREVLGIVTMLPYKPGSERMQKVFRGDTSILLGDVDITPEDIEVYRPGNHIELYVAEIGINPNLGNKLKRNGGAKLISKSETLMVSLGSKGVIVENILSVGASKSGVKLLQHFGFSEIVFERPDTRMFELNILQSGAPVAVRYRKALAESKV